MPNIEDPALLAIARAKFSLDEELEESRQQLTHLTAEVSKASKVYDDAVKGRDRAAQRHAQLQENMNRLNDAERILKKETEDPNAKEL